MRANRLAVALMTIVFAFRIDTAPANAEPSHLIHVPAARLVGVGNDAAPLIDWAVGRFGGAGLAVPTVDIQVHEDRGRCDGHLGMTSTRQSG